MVNERATWNLRRVVVAAAVPFASGLLGGCLGLGFDRELMLGTVAETVILPAHRALLGATAELDAGAAEFASEPTTERLELLRQRWLEASLAWKHVELYEFPGLLLIHNAIERRPARVAFIEQAIEEADEEALETLDAAFIETLGATSKGLGAIEYLIFPSEVHAVPVLESFGDPSRAAYLTALTGNLSAKSEELLRFWTPEGDNYAQTFRQNDSEGADIQGSISLLANEMIELHEVVMRTRLGMPMGQTTDGVPQPDEVESYRSGRSLELMIASVEAIQRTFDAGLDDYLDYLDRSPAESGLSTAIRLQLEVVLDALGEIDLPLQEAVTERPEQVEAAFEAMRPLLVLLKTDMAALLGITVTFSDSDGD